MRKHILIAEDEQVLRESLAELLADEGFEVTQAANGSEAYQAALESPYDLVLSDIRMPEMDGLDLLDRLRKAAPETPVVMLTAYGTVDSAVKAMQSGAADYLLKPVQFEDLLAKVKRSLEWGEMSRRCRQVTDQLAADCSFHNLIGESQNMTKLYDMVRTLSGVMSNVLIVGESGTGKELFARAIHYNGITRDKPFVPVNCGAIPESLIESELFGHRRGSFTGAIKDKVGYFEAANNGTIFLDEISTLPVGVQSTLLRVLEERVVIPVGDTQARPVNVRVIAASNRDLATMVTEGEFREDLLFRLDVVQLQLPPLSQRKEDIPLLAHHFLEKYMREMNRNVLGVTNGAMRALLQHNWRGNVRELENVIERAVIFAENRAIGVEDLPFDTGELSDDVSEDLKDALRQFERQHIMSSLKRHNNDKAETAKYLGIGVSSLYRKLEELNIPKNAGQNGESHAENGVSAEAEA
ncbi:MAG: sigma-54-dependent Fis family transcriptional regulator [Planctomycetes bacterium]|nr:sigma-54-dependent Fis family transcriptional regulator [Planctomycetota bacterium]NOG53725.1 sigma-54-dependent Fis family transcriptional regulator [Planctomycetota bacterium]